jgi:hypothetical protein
VINFVVVKLIPEEVTFAGYYSNWFFAVVATAAVGLILSVEDAVPTVNVRDTPAVALPKESVKNPAGIETV